MGQPGSRSAPRSPQQQLLRVALLGGLDLRLGDERIPPLDSARAESLLAYLLLHREAPQQRRHLAFMLWPDSTESQARTNLRHVLHNLRRALPDPDRLLDVGPRTLQWRPQVPWSLDVAVFEQALAEGRLEDAVGAYDGDLLEGNYDDWLLEERERLRQLLLDALERLAHRLEEQGRVAEAARHAERLLRHDPLREESYRLLIRLYDAAGDRARALRTYHACATTLVRELGVEPSARTRGAYESLLEAGPEQPTEEPAPASPARPPLVGRRAERARLIELWREAEAGRPRFAAITGEAGIGKSRLVEELRLWCARNGAATAEARSYPTGGAMAYGALAAWLRSDAVAKRLRALAPVDLTELGRLLPELRPAAPAASAPEPLAPDEQRRRLFAAARAALALDPAPLLLVAEDIQWCDADTLHVVHHLLRTTPDARLLVVATARADELDSNHPVYDLLADLQAIGVGHEIALPRLSREETARLAGELGGGSLDPGDAERLYEDSEGVPLFLVEALRDGLAPDRPAPGGMSDRVRAVIGSRLARLSQPAAELVEVAAAIGREFTVDVLADASGASEQDLVRGLDELWRRAIVRARGPNAYDFSHGKIQEAAYRALGPARTRHHHLRVAHALERAQAGQGDPLSGQIAAHYEAAGAAGQAMDWYRRAAEAAQRLAASSEAARFLERALTLLEQLPAGPDRDLRELRLLTHLPTPLVTLEGYLSDRVAEVHQRAVELAGALAVDLEAPLVRSLALASLARGDFEAGQRFGRQLRERGERDGDDVLRVEAGYVLGIAAYWQGRLAEARDHFEDTIDRCRADQRPLHLVRYGQDPEVVCLTRLAHTLWLLGEAEDAERARERGLRLAAERGHPYSRAVAMVFAGILALDRRDAHALGAHAEALASVRSAYTAPQIRIVADLFAGLVGLLGGEAPGELDRVRAIVADARRDAPATPGFHSLLMRVLVEACAAAGEADIGLATAEEALEIGDGIDLWQAEIRRLRAEFLHALGADGAEVDAELARAVRVATDQAAKAFQQRALATRDRLLAGAR